MTACMDHLDSDCFDYCFTFRAAFFAGARLGLALATVGFVAFATAITALSHRVTCIVTTTIIITIITTASAFIFARKGHKSLERDRLGAILRRSDCASESADEVNASRTLLHRAVRTNLPDLLLALESHGRA
jgi:hypothetical protein